MSTRPGMFSAGNPRLQLAWDATSLNQLMWCPRSYQYTILEGYSGESNDLQFGILVHSAMDRFTKAVLSGTPREEALFDTVKWALLETWPEDKPSPWSGYYARFWHCTGDVPYKNEKGNRAKCPLAHKGVWQPVMGDLPVACPRCTGSVEAETQWVPVDPKKDRYALIRLIVWYTDEQTLNPSEGVVFYQFPDGTPAVELPFRIPLPYKTKDGESYVLAGYLDAIKTFGSEAFVADYKTTKKPLGSRFFDGFSPSGQMDTYDLAGTVLYPDLNLQGVMIEGLSLVTNGARFGRGLLYRNDEYREEWLKEIGHWLQMAEKFATDDYWPMQRSNCWMCPFNGVCSTAPSQRKRVLDAEFERRYWNPLDER